MSLMVGCKKGRCMTQLLSHTQHVRRMAPWAKQRIKGSSAARNNTDLSGVVDVVADIVFSALLQSNSGHCSVAWKMMAEIGLSLTKSGARKVCLV